MTDTSSEGILKPGDVLNNTYVIAELVASGGTGEVYRATNRVSGREIAVKILKEEFAQDEQFTDLMKREASVLHEVIDPSVVRYYDLLESDMHGGFLFIVMEFIHGPSLADNMRRTGPLTADVLVKVSKRILMGLKAAHDKKAFHRDLSPDNVILRDDDPMQATLIDFGIAKDVNEGAKTVIGDGFAGKYQYAAPEQMEGNADGRSDLYSLGMTLIGAYRGQSPSAGSSLMQIIKAKTEKPDISDMDGALHALVSRLVEPDPADRFDTADAALAFMEAGSIETPPAPLAEAFDSEKTVIMPRTSTPSSQPITVPPTPVATGSEQTIERIQQSMQEPKKSKTGLWIALGLLLIGGGGAGGWYAGLFDPAPQPPVQTAVNDTQAPETARPPKNAPPSEDVNPDLAVPSIPVAPDVQSQQDTTLLQSPSTDQTGSPTQASGVQDNQPISDQAPGQLTTPGQDSTPQPIPKPQQDPTAPPAPSPGQMTAPGQTTTSPDSGSSLDSAPGQLVTPGQVATPQSTSDTSPTAAPTVLPVASPYRLSIKRTGPDAPLILRGNLPSAESLPPITTILEDQLDSYAVQAEIKPASGMPADGWDSRIVAIALNFAQLDIWHVSASDNTVTLKANARNAAERTALLNAARRILQGTEMTIDDQISVQVNAVKQADVDNGLQKLRSCGPLLLTSKGGDELDGDAEITVSGKLASAHEISQVQAYLNEAAPGRTVINDLTVVNSGVCSILQILPDSKSNKLRIDYALGASDNRVRNDTYHMGQNPVIDIAVDARATGYMSVIFVDQSEQVFHLLPHQARKQNQIQEIGTVRDDIRYVRVAFPITEASVEKLGFKVVEPLGANMIVAVVTPDPLFNDLRPRAESNAAFIAAVQNKLVFANESDGIVTFRSLITEP